MLRNNALSCLVVLSVLVTRACVAGAATPVPSFTITASNVTMPSSGEVSIPFTLTSVNGFVGSVGILCSEPTVAGSKHEGPYCENYGAVQSYSLSVNGTATGGYKIVAIKPPLVPAAGLRHSGGATWALAGVLMLGLGLRKRSQRLARGLLGMGLIGLTGLGLSGCGGPPTLRPGDYVFTLTAQSVSNGTLIPVITASTTATVTVPAGIVTDSSNGN